MTDRPTRVEGEPDGFKFSDSPRIQFDVEGSMTLQAQKLSVHEGRIQGLNTAFQAIQGSLNFWQAAALGIAALIFAALAVTVTYQIQISDQVREQGERTGKLERKVDALPGEISRSLRETSRDLVLITQSARTSPLDDGSAQPEP